MTATPRQREIAADALRAGQTQQAAAEAAGIALSTLTGWLKKQWFQAMRDASPEIRPGLPPRPNQGNGPAPPAREPRSQIWLASSSGDVLGSHIPAGAFESPDSVLHVHVVPPEVVEEAEAAIAARAYPADSAYIPVPLAGLDELLDNLPLLCRLGSPDPQESLGAWLELWTLIDEEGRTQTLADSLWQGQRRFLEALVEYGHVLSIKARKVGLSTLILAHAAWTARIRDRNASVHLLSYREDAARELLRGLRRGFDGLPPFLRLPLERETQTVLAYSAGPGDTRRLKVFPATPKAAIEATCSHLVLDEWAHTFDPEAVWTALEPTLPARASSALITTAHDPGDFVHDYYLRSEAGETRHTAVFISALERPDRSSTWLEAKRHQEGKRRSLRNYPLTAEEAFAAAGEPYFAPELLEAAQRDALPPSPAEKGVRYLEAWDIGRKDASVCVVLRAPSPEEEAQHWHVVGYRRLVGEDFPAIQREIEAMHREYPGPTVVEDNSIGLPLIQNLRLPENQLIQQTTTESSKQAMLTELELQLQHQTLKIHPDFRQLLAELAEYRLPDTTLTQDSVMALGFAVLNRREANATPARGRIDRKRFYELNDLTPPDPHPRQLLAVGGPAFGLLKLNPPPGSDQSPFRADACTGQLEQMLDEGWTVDDPADLKKLGLEHLLEEQ